MLRLYKFVLFVLLVLSLVACDPPQPPVDGQEPLVATAEAVQEAAGSLERLQSDEPLISFGGDN